MILNIEVVQIYFYFLLIVLLFTLLLLFFLFYLDLDLNNGLFPLETKADINKFLEGCSEFNWLIYIKA